MSTESSRNPQADAASPTHAAAPGGSPRRSAGFPTPVIHALASVLGAVVVWLAIQSAYPFAAPKLPPPVGGNPAPPSPEQMAMFARVHLQNALALGATFGAALAAALAIAAAIARRSWFQATIGLISGLVIGGASGAAAGWCAQRVLESSLPVRLGDNFGMAAVFAVCWAVVGLGVGIAASLPSGNWRHLISAGLAALVAGFAASLVYPLFEAIAGIFWLSSASGELFPNGAINRLLWFVAPAVLIGLAVSLTARAAAPILGRTERV